MPAQRRAHQAGADFQLRRPLGHESLALRQEHELVEPRDEQCLAVVSADLDVTLLRIRARFFRDQLGERVQRLEEDGRLAGRLDLELQLRGVLDPTVRHVREIPERPPTETNLG